MEDHEKKVKSASQVQVDGLLSAAKKEYWGKVDQVIIPEIEANPDGDGVARELLKHIRDDDPNVRDAVATGLASVDITQRSLLRETFTLMSMMSLTDPEVFPSGRAAMFLAKYRDHEEFGSSPDNLLSDFAHRASEACWTDELIENIPGMSDILGVV